MATAIKSIPFVVPLEVPAEPITQLELAALLSLRGRLCQLEEQVEAAQSSIQSRLEKGAAVELGDHVVRIETHSRANVSWKQKAIDLAERLGLNGEAWAQNVLSHTAKTPTKSLFVA